MSEPFLGEIRMAGFNFAPQGWAFCNGQILSISQNTALFSLLGTTYGGNGQTTFALPNLQSRVPMHFGQGPGLSPRTQGESAGSENITLLSTQMPAHNHIINGVSEQGDISNPQNAVLAISDNGGNQYSTNNPNTTMKPQAVSVAGGNQPHDNMQPYLVVNFIIALEGIYPSRG